MSMFAFHNYVTNFAPKGLMGISCKGMGSSHQMPQHCFYKGLIKGEILSIFNKIVSH